MTSSEWLKDLRQKVERAKGNGITDEQLAYSVMAVRSRQPPAAELTGHEELVFKLAWLLAVRAPGLDLSWLLKGVLDLDKVFWGTLTLDDLIGKIQSLEQAVQEEFGNPEDWLSSPQEHPHIDPIRAAAARLPEMEKAQGPALEEYVQADLKEVQRCTDEGELLALISSHPRGF